MIAVASEASLGLNRYSGAGMTTPSIRAIISDRELATVSPEMKVREACKVLGRLNVGAAVVLGGERLLGILSERDVIRKCICQHRLTDNTRIADIMTANPVVLDFNGTFARALQKMNEGHFRHLPVMEGNRVIGILSQREIPTDNHVLIDRFGEIFKSKRT